MPPKKQEEEVAAPVIVWTVLPVLCHSALALEALRKPVTIKKALDKVKLIELLKDKGIDKFVEQGALNRQGQLFLCENMEAVGQQYLVQCRKPADPKKDQKKDTKKDSKKEEVVVEQSQKPLEFDFAKAVTEFLFYLDIPLDPEALQTAFSHGFKPEIVVVVKEQVKEGTDVPSYDILNNQRTLEDFIHEMNSTRPENTSSETKVANISNGEAIANDAIRTIKNLRMQADSPLENTILIEVPFQKDLQHPERDTQSFLSDLFKKICEVSVKRQEYDNWCKEQKVFPMVPTIKETVKKEIVVQEKKDEKKGGKGAPAAPVTEIVEEIVQRKYESFPQNIKSDLLLYKRITQQRKNDQNKSKYYNILQNLALAVSSATEPHPKPTFLAGLGQALWSQQTQKPVNSITVRNLRTQLPEIMTSDSSKDLTFTVSLDANPVASEVPLPLIMKKHPSEVSLSYEYKLEQLTALSKSLDSRIFYSFEDRRYVERLDCNELNARINQELEFDPKVYHAQCPEDGYSLMILAKVNPPGRILYSNHVFDWRVRPNFQYWQDQFDNKQEAKEFFDYSWRQAGNLKILGTKMMPTDNTVITESLLTCGDSEKRIITLSKGNVQYGFQGLASGIHIFWKQQAGMKTSIYTASKGSSFSKSSRPEIEICVQKKEFTVIFTPHPVIFWHEDGLELSRCFGPAGQITKRMRDGSTEIMYPNGDRSVLKFGKWTHIRNNSISTETGERSMRIDQKIETDKKIFIREDSTVFTHYSPKDRAIVFSDGTHLRKKSPRQLQILNPANIVIRINLPRNKDFNVIGAGSAFAYLGFTNILQRSYDEALYELYHPSFSWHTYTEGIDRTGAVSKQQVVLLAYPDKSMMKVNDSGLLTFVNETENKSQEHLQERWIQLFTAPQYHLQGIYDVDLIEGQIQTHDAQSNHFRSRIDGTGKTQIAVSFNIGALKEEKNHYGPGMHVPEQNYFLPPPDNFIAPRLFIIYPDRTGEEYLNEEQIADLRSWREVKEVVNNRSIRQYSREAVFTSDYLQNTFSAKIDTSIFSKPNLVSEAPKNPNNVSFTYNSIYFRTIEEIQWNSDFSRVRQVRERIRSKREQLNSELQSLRERIKA